MSAYDELTERQLLLSSWQTLRRIEQAMSAREELPTPIVNVGAPDLTDIVNAVMSLNGTGPTAEEIAQAIAGVLAPQRAESGSDALQKVAQSLEKLDFRLQGVGTQAYGGGSSQLQAQTPSGGWDSVKLNENGELVVTTSAGGGGGGLTDTQLRATPVPVSGTVTVTDGAGSLTVDGTVAVSNFPGTQPVSGTVAISNPTANPETGLAKDATLTTRLPAALDADGGIKTHVQNTVPVTGTFWQATQPVSLATNTPDVTDRAARLLGHVTVDNASLTVATGLTQPLTDTQLRASAVPVSGTFFQATQPVSMATQTPTLQGMGAASNTPTGVVSLGNTLGKTNVLKTGNLASSAVTADQVILTYTVTSGKTFYLEYFDFSARLTTFATTATFFGAASLETPSGTKVYTIDLSGAGATQWIGQDLSEPIAIAAGTVVRVVCTPSATTAFTWKANFGGYEK